MILSAVFISVFTAVMVLRPLRTVLAFVGLAR